MVGLNIVVVGMKKYLYIILFIVENFNELIVISVIEQLLSVCYLAFS